MLKVVDFKKVRSIEGFEALGFSAPVYDTGRRGGRFGYHGSEVSRLLDIPEDSISGISGAYCNYLGGGIRGAVTGSGYSSSLPKAKQALVKAFQDACVTVYINLENGTGLNDPEYPDGDTNWEAQGTAASRKAGIVSAY